MEKFTLEDFEEKTVQELLDFLSFQDPEAVLRSYDDGDQYYYVTYYYFDDPE